MLYFCQCFHLLIFLATYSPALNGSSRKFYTWWTLTVIREVTTWIFSWSSLNYRVGQKVTKFGIFQTPPANFLLSRPNAAEYCNFEKNLLSTDGCSTCNATFRELWRTNPWDPCATLLFLTRGQSNLTKSASQGAHSPVRGHPRVEICTIEFLG